MTSPEELRALWDRTNQHQRDRWREHVAEALPERLLDADGPVEELPD